MAKNLARMSGRQNMRPSGHSHKSNAWQVAHSSRIDSPIAGKVISYARDTVDGDAWYQSRWEIQLNYEKIMMHTRAIKIRGGWCEKGWRLDSHKSQMVGTFLSKLWHTHRATDNEWGSHKGVLWGNIFKARFLSKNCSPDLVSAPAGKC